MDNKVRINEDKMDKERSFFQKVQNTIFGMILGLVLIQSILFLLGLGSIVLWWDNQIVIFAVVFCMVMGWVVGPNFLYRISSISSEFWDLILSKMNR